MPSPTFDSTFFCSMPEMFPTTIADNDPIQHSLIPHYHIKHPKWYFDDADLFFSQRGVLFGLHQHKFNNPYFSRQLKHIEPCKTTAIGIVLGSPVSGLQKDRDWTGPRPVRTGNSRDRRRLQLQSSLRSLKILEVSRQRPVLTGFNQSFQ